MLEMEEKEGEFEYNEGSSNKRRKRNMKRVIRVLSRALGLRVTE
jgi:hypothetical protein